MKNWDKKFSAAIRRTWPFATVEIATEDFNRNKVKIIAAANKHGFKQGVQNLQTIWFDKI